MNVAKDPNRPDFAAGKINLASSALGARKVFVTDEFFAPVERMLSEEDPVWREGIYDENGKWMDGWESRRKRDPGHDIAVIELATSGRFVGFDVNTRFFTGNYAPAVSIDAAYAPELRGRDDLTPDDFEWTEVLPKRELSGNSRVYIELEDPAFNEHLWTHIRVHIYPDGGIARLKIYGDPAFDWSKVPSEEELDLAYVFHGGMALHWSDAHFGRPDKLLRPGRGTNMGDGWETARRRGPGYDWAVIKLGHKGIIDRVEIDTAHFKGNYPQFGEVLAADLGDFDDYFTQAMLAQSEVWEPVLVKQKLEADHIHTYRVENPGPATHIRFNIFPDGGISRLRLYGRKA
ncbi:MAG: allantoicase [Pseudomonadota bacterium]